jgi:hypothetical protein
VNANGHTKTVGGLVHRVGQKPGRPRVSLGSRGIFTPEEGVVRA